MKETAGLEFKFGIKYQDEKKQKISTYELGKNNVLIDNRRRSDAVTHVEGAAEFYEPAQLLGGNRAGPVLAGQRAGVAAVLDNNFGRNNLAGA
jgi:hypothetical protein